MDEQSVQDFLLRQREAAARAEIAAKENEFNIERYPNGTRYEGEFKYAIPPSHAPWLAVTQSLVSAAKHGRVPHGKGELYNATNQLIYDGQWVDGEMSGRGKLHCKNFTWEGNFKNGLPHGKVLVTPDVDEDNEQRGTSKRNFGTSRISAAFNVSKRQEPIEKNQETESKMSAGASQPHTGPIKKPTYGFFHRGVWHCWQHELIQGAHIAIRMKHAMPMYDATILRAPSQDKGSRYYVLFHEDSMRNHAREDEGRWVDLSSVDFELQSASNRDISWCVRGLSEQFFKEDCNGGDISENSVSDDI